MYVLLGGLSIPEKYPRVISQKDILEEEPDLTGSDDRLTRMSAVTYPVYK